MHFLKLIRFQNLLLIALMQGLLHFVFLKRQAIPVFLSVGQFSLLCAACICIAAGGYVINNILDVGTDLENKPDDVVVGRTISEATAYNLYFALTVAGVGLGFYVSNQIGYSSFAGIFIIVAALLYLYASSYKRILLVGNLVVALLLGLSAVIVGVFDLLPVTFSANKPMMATVFGVILDYSLFAFLINLLREVVKDMEDVNGDYNLGMNTLPISIGVERTGKIVSVFGLLLACLLGWYAFTYLFELLFVTLYILVFLIAPLLFFSVRIWQGAKQSDFYFCGQLLKWIVLFGIVLIPVVTFNMEWNAAQ